MRYVFETHTPEETIALGQRIGALLHAGDVIAYRGDLGAGKTTFTRGLAMGMGLPDCVTSPTFALAHVYGAPPLQLCHFDLYRISSEEELETTGFYDYLPEESVFAVEWSENIGTLPGRTVTLTLERTGDTDRRITLEGDDRFAHLGT